MSELDEEEDEARKIQEAIEDTADEDEAANNQRIIFEEASLLGEEISSPPPAHVRVNHYSKVERFQGFKIQVGAMNRRLLIAGLPPPPFGGCERKD
jgi:hypothetical protein